MALDRALRAHGRAGGRRAWRALSHRGGGEPWWKLSPPTADGCSRSTGVAPARDATEVAKSGRSPALAERGVLSALDSG
ncbi:hypothetical protein [Streptomyces sp. NPDC059209]|uniref:hypothetical protein n=1 Tax=Streptomyces sp. NPDC059209 TaxID=3346769 RepID=UPI0036CB3A59